jgi:hypothetical protein
VGLGTQDDADFARRFLARTEVTHRLLWDPGFDSWAELGIASQPSAVLFAPDGRELRRWSGLFNEAEVLGLIEGATPEKAAGAGNPERFCRSAQRFAQAQDQLRAVAEPGATNDQVLAAGDDQAFSANGLLQHGADADRAVLDELAAAGAELRRALRSTEGTDTAGVTASLRDRYGAAVAAASAVTEERCEVVVTSGLST